MYLQPNYQKNLYWKVGKETLQNAYKSFYSSLILTKYLDNLKQRLCVYVYILLYLYILLEGNFF